MNRSNFPSRGVILIAVSVAIAATVMLLRGTDTGLDRKPDRQRAPSPEGDMAQAEVPASLQTMYRTVALLQNNYLDAGRIQPEKMLLSAMDELELDLPALLATPRENQLEIHVGSHSRLFPLSDLKTSRVLLQRMGEIFSFIEEHVESTRVDLKELQYTAINGMLRVLDPHTVLLTPDYYRSMKDRTHGNFGGLGIVISIRDGELTIVSPISGTPADRAGLISGDIVTKIDEASTVNMPINDAVDLMRGEPGTTVTLQVKRAAWPEERRIRLVRAEIKVRSMDSALMPGNVGYIIIHDFQANTAQDLEEHLQKLSATRKTEGLILDLRSNPGGLLTAAIDVADVFLDSGVIVTTAGQKLTDRKVEKASASGREPHYPIVVLVDSGSASASEIVAGALKRHNRAVLVGERTFGKGSVQVLHEFDDQSALKMTTAQYLTPGDISIQSVGIAPHVETQKVRADADMVDLKKPVRYREGDLADHFERISRRQDEDETDIHLRYLYVPERIDHPTGDETEEDEPSDDTIYNFRFNPDFEIRLARELILEMKRRKIRAFEKESLAPLVARMQQKETARLSDAFRRMGVDWTAGKETGAVQLTPRVRLPGDTPRIDAGGEGILEVSVHNTGTVSIYQLLATTRSDFTPLDQRELAFGAVRPGETAVRTLSFKVPLNAGTRTDDVKISFEDMNANPLPEVATRFSVKGIELPVFSSEAHLLDVAGGNGDGQAQVGETIRLVATIRNTGTGDARAVLANVRNESGNDIFLRIGRAELGEMKSGETRKAVFEFDIKKGFTADTVRFKLSVMDSKTQVYSGEALSFPISPPLQVKALATSVSLRQGTLLRAVPSADGPIVGRTGQDAVMTSPFQCNGFLRVDVSEEESGWVRQADTQAAPAGATTTAVQIEPTLNTPPSIRLEPFPDVTDRPRIPLTGVARDDQRVRSIYIFNNNQKVFFQSNSGSSARFTMDLDLEPGINFVTVVAEETEELQTRTTLIIRRDGKANMPFISARDIKGTPEPLGVIPSNAR